MVKVKQNWQRILIIFAKIRPLSSSFCIRLQHVNDFVGAGNVDRIPQGFLRYYKMGEGLIRVIIDLNIYAQTNICTGSSWIRQTLYTILKILNKKRFSSLCMYVSVANKGAQGL